MKLFVTNNIYFCSTKSAAWLQKKEIEELPKKSANFSKCTKSNPTQTSNYIRPKTIPRQELTCFQKLFACINTGYYCFLLYGILSVFFIGGLALSIYVIVIKQEREVLSSRLASPKQNKNGWYAG